MKKFVLLTVGFIPPSPEMMKGWMSWFKSIGSSMVEHVGLANGKEVTADVVKDLSMDLEAITGYVVITAESMDEALEIAKQCPAITSTKVYELRSH